MTFRELLVKYKNGTLSEDEKILVEQELEKSEAINDYLADEIEKSIGLNYNNELKQYNVLKHSNLLKQNKYQNTADINVKDSNEITKHIKKTVNKRLACRLLAC
mgnify:FL=1